MIYGTVCSGIAADAVAWKDLGWKCAFVSEIAPFPSALLAHHYPEIPNLGDFTKAETPARVDLLFGGTPCQSFSVAGLRGGLDDDRGNLALEFLRFAQRTRARWVVWENVFGVLSVDEGRAFGSILGGLAELGYGWAYRILDAQHLGVPQRRRRVFVVGYLGDWRRAAAVLFERHSLSCDSPPRRAPREEVAGPLGAGTPGSGWRDDLERSGAFVVNALTSSDGGADDLDAQGNRLVARPLLARATGHRYDLDTETFIAGTLKGKGHDASEDGSGRQNLIAIQDARDSNEAKGQNGLGVSEEGVAYTLDTTGAQAICFDVAQITHPENRVNPQPGDPAPPLAASGRTHIAFSSKDSGSDAGDVAPTLRAGGFDKSHANGGAPPAVAYSIVPEGGQSADLTASAVEVAPALTARGERQKHDRGTRIATKSSVRRLTPLECERLQGFPIVLDRVILDLSFDRHENVVHAVPRCLRWLGSALHADVGENSGSVSFADANSMSDQESGGSLAVVRVRIGSEPKAVELRSRGRLIWSANGAAASEWSHHPTADADFALAIAEHAQSLVLAVRSGKAASPASTIRFSVPASGGWPVAMFGRESEVDAKDVDADSREMATSTTSGNGPDTRPCDLSVQTSLSSVFGIIASFIPGTTERASFCRLVIDVETGYTKIPGHTADGPRYEALGNTIAIPPLEWIGHRIDAVERLTYQREGETPK